MQFIMIKFMDYIAIIAIQNGEHLIHFMRMIIQLGVL